jgi:hypothetical protein
MSERPIMIKSRRIPSLTDLTATYLLKNFEYLDLYRLPRDLHRALFEKYRDPTYKICKSDYPPPLSKPDWTCSWLVEDIRWDYDLWEQLENKITTEQDLSKYLGIVMDMSLDQTDQRKFEILVIVCGILYLNKWFLDKYSMLKNSFLARLSEIGPESPFHKSASLLYTYFKS